MENIVLYSSFVAHDLFVWDLPNLPDMAEIQ